MLPRLASLFASILLVATAFSQEVAVTVQSPGAGPAVTKDSRYRSHVTLYIQVRRSRGRWSVWLEGRKKRGASTGNWVTPRSRLTKAS